MPKPQATYLLQQRRDKISHHAKHGKAAVSVAERRELAGFYEELDRVAEQDLDAWHRSMASLVNDIKNGEPSSENEKVRKRVSDVLGEVRTVLEKVQDYKQLEGRLQLPVEPIMRAPVNLGAGSALLPLAIALCQTLEILVRIRRRRR